LLQDPSDWGRRNAGEAIEPAVERETVRASIARIAQGAFGCPSCDLPLLLSGVVSIRARIACPFCGGVHSARQYVRIDAIDTGRNQVYLRARLPG